MLLPPIPVQKPIKYGSHSLGIVSRHQVTCLQMFNLAVRNVDAKLLYLCRAHYAIIARDQ